MNAIVQSTYGLPDVLQMAQVPRPTPAPGEVLVRVAAVGLNKGDWHLLTGTPYLVRAVFGLRAPKRPIPGMAVAGRIEAVGAGVDRLVAGDEVFGEIPGGALAEYVAVKETLLAKKPAGISMEDAATLPIAATTALQGLRDAGAVQAGQSVLVNGAAGGVGSFAVQIARSMGARVTAVCSGRNAEWVRGLGAAHVIDYGQEDFTQGEPRYDAIFDLVGNHGRAACRRVLTAHGRLLASAGGADHPWVGPMLDMLTGMLSNLFSAQKYVPVAAAPNLADLTQVAELVAAGHVRPVIDRRYTLSETADAMRYLGQGHTRGKSVILL